MTIIIGTVGYAQTSKVQRDRKCIMTLDETCHISVCTFPDKFPEFPGGVAELGQFIQKNIRPSKENNGSQSRVFLSFIVAETGKIECLRIVNKMTQEYSVMDKDVLQGMAKMPNWIPAQCNGTNVAALYSLPITICLANQ
ncbi:hypothetical protein QNI19_13895 [Cytophagaceae bacterium DM2B3-1]|uniref:TonB C-terminal domain-containing protein n=1 Tax=Xanthocytophaga flava TaxID=3048013 RepID=A0ABT7CM10_9BACT|nr:hypothetical protein [Xanthocytophaga flavus]MDJ1469458.1 hypothetical protein [Xanthocytophaga flavus]MDJ1494030.1 hypothetical protein [Xanthocytophaga flavus]